MFLSELVPISALKWFKNSASPNYSLPPTRYFPLSLMRHLLPLTLRCLGAFTVLPAALLAQPPPDAHALPLDELRPGMIGEVWTVFSGTEPESFTVKVTGIIHNALGPGKSMILCELTDPRVQNMGAVAGMSGSPLYIDGRLAGALSYQVQRFETVRYAGFTPIADLREVQQIALNAPRSPGGLPHDLPTLPADQRTSPSALSDPFQPLAPVFTLGGLSPSVAQLFAPHFAALGIATTTLGGSLPTTSTSPSGSDPANPPPPATLRPGDAVAAALAIGDITLAGTGTVSQVQGDRVLAFGHPLMGLGSVEVPMAAAEIVTILPSNLSSFKISNTGAVLGTVRQDRLSAIYGELGPAPALVPMTVHSPQRTLRFSTVRHPRLTPMIAAAGLTQAVLGSNDAGLTEGFSVATRVTFPDGRVLTSSDLFAGPTGFNAGLNAFTQKLTLWLQNPVEQIFPADVTFTVEPLPANPTASIDNVTVSHREAAPGATVTLALTLRDFQSQPLREILTLPIDSAWAGRDLEVIISAGPTLDTLELGQNDFPIAQIRSLDAFLDVLARQRRSDGLYIALVARTDAFIDQTSVTHELPGSLARIARGADEARYRERNVLELLWETHILPGRLITTLERRHLRIRD